MTDARPEDLLEGLEQPVAGALADAVHRAAPFAPAHAPAPNVASAPGSRKEQAVLLSISSSYFRLRRGLALIALVFPILLWLRGGPDELRTSISAYYHAPPDGIFPSTRDLFVGVLCAVGAFLYFYKGYSKRKMAALNAAGIAALVIALVPVDYPYNPDRWPWCPASSTISLRSSSSPPSPMSASPAPTTHWN
jgi:hypothetical protein